MTLKVLHLIFATRANAEFARSGKENLLNPMLGELEVGKLTFFLFGNKIMEVALYLDKLLVERLNDDKPTS